jgi:hypothetical protein
LDIVCNLGMSFNVDSSWISWALEIEIVLAILVVSDFIWTWDQIHCNVYLILFVSICRTSKSNFVSILDVNLNARWS